jgi:Arc/MetJ-type ribon-helix-helix transcriptional regulator
VVTAASRGASRYGVRMTSQIAIRLPDELLADLDWVVIRLDAPSRADAVRVALERLVDQERRREVDEQYVEAYTRQPQTDDEVAFARAALGSLATSESWDDIEL